MMVTEAKKGRDDVQVSSEPTLFSHMDTDVCAKDVPTAKPSPILFPRGSATESVIVMVQPVS